MGLISILNNSSDGPRLQEKTTTPIVGSNIILPDSGYDGMTQLTLTDLNKRIDHGIITIGSTMKTIPIINNGIVNYEYIDSVTDGATIFESGGRKYIGKVITSSSSSSYYASALFTVNIKNNYPYTIICQNWLSSTNGYIQSSSYSRYYIRSDSYYSLSSTSSYQFDSSGENSKIQIYLYATLYKGNTIMVGISNLYLNILNT